MNTLKTFFLLMVLSMMLIVIGGVIGGQAGIIIALVFALVMNMGAYWFSDKIALGMTKSQPITEHDDPGALQHRARAGKAVAGLPMPKVYEIHTESPNAFATGRSPKNAAVAVTTGIRRILTREELSAVLAHEMAHVGNRDTLIMAVVATIAGAISMLAMIAQFSAIFGGMFGGREGPGQHRRPVDHRHRHADSSGAGAGGGVEAPASSRPTPPELTTAATRLLWPARCRSWNAGLRSARCALPRGHPTSSLSIHCVGPPSRVSSPPTRRLPNGYRG